MIFVLVVVGWLLLHRALEKPERGTTTTDADGGGMVMHVVSSLLWILEPRVVVARYSLLS